MAWSSEQIKNAAIIYKVGRAMGMSTRDIQIGLITAMVESNLVNVNYGDRDSLGLFQQRPSQGWGSPAQVQDPYYASRKFFTTLRGLGDRRLQMGMGDAAQAVQRSAYPGRYAERIPSMRSIWPRVADAAGAPQSSMDGVPYTQGFDPQTLLAEGLEAQGLDPSSMQLAAEGDLPMMSEDGQVDTGVPDASTMLGAWGMNSPQPAPEIDWEDDALNTILSQSTNTQIITPLSQEMGNFEPGVDGWRNAVIQAARTALGKPYVWGGNSLASGVDCSGLIQQAFLKAGLNLPRVSYQQANFGKRVGLKSLRPGDLVAWDNSSRNNGADHIALYIGNGMIIEAARPGTAVRTRKLGANEGAWGVQLNF